MLVNSFYYRFFSTITYYLLFLKVEEQNMTLNRELNNLKSQLEEQERDADDILKKYQNHIQNVIFYN
jgi:hypothetical protein